MTEAEDEFTVHYSVGPGQSAFSVLSSGQTFPVGELSKLRRKIRRCLEHNTGPEPVVKYLVQDIHRVAARNRTVGRSMMVVSLPKQTASSAQQMFLTDLAPLGPRVLKDMASFYYVSRLGADKTRFGPNIVCGRQGFKSFRIERLNDSGRDASIEATLVLPEQ
jgi:hypothetical protein